ncbi:MAG: ribonuclease III domain-containing protein [Clostridia bacterium]|nr:ribonuclease III domain-containing protein [Clostridia bacterium]
MEIFNRNKGIEEVNQMSPLTWAYVGDCVYELYIRTKLVDTTKLKPHELHIKSVKYVKAKAQAETLKKLETILTEEEKEIVRRGRNTQTHHIAKNASMQDYMYATAFEALIGYLYLTKQDDRLFEIMKMEI